MAIKKRYFSLKAKGGNAFIPDGKRFKFTQNTVNIGETADCDIRYTNVSTLPDYYASILCDDENDSWYIVARSSDVPIHISGKGNIGFAQTLTDGDVIQFEGQEMTLLFRTHYDDKYEDTEEKHHLWQWVVAIACCLLAAVLTWQLNQPSPITEADVAPLEESLFLVKVDSVQHKLNEKLIRPTLVLNDNVPTGTAFLTTDSILVTARHCVEYWIGDNLDLTTKVADLADDDIIRWAIETETYNQTSHPDSMMTLEVFFSVYDFMGEKRYSFSSTDSIVHFNRSRDGVFILADFNDEYYWRSIRPYFKDTQMELGDILWIDNLSEAGKIVIATPQDMKQIHKGSRLMIYGYPITGMNDRRATVTEGVIKHDASPTTENLVFEANINHGFSGGPVLTKTSHGIVAAGVVSRVDSISSGIYKRAVPITEVYTKIEENHE